MAQAALAPRASAAELGIRRNTATVTSPSSKRILLAAACLLALLALQFLLYLRECREAKREALLLPAIQEAALRHRLPASLVRALIWRESRFFPDAVGSHDEVGLMQITDGAVADWARVNRRETPSRRTLFEPETNLEIGCWYLSNALAHWEGYRSQEALALSEYNAGRAAVLREWKPESPDEELPLEKITFPGTQNYVRKILLRREHYRRLENAPSGLSLPPS